MTCTAKVVAASISTTTHQRITTLELEYWRAIHAEFMTHRVFSRNAGSSRAIPVETMLHQVWHNPAGPTHWGVNQPGMQARAELVGWRRALAGGLWRTAAKTACVFAWGMMKLNVHKQIANRLLEPFQYIRVIVTATDWDNFFELRCHKDAMPEIQELAYAMHRAINSSRPAFLEPGEWHLPYVTDTEIAAHGGRKDPSGILRKLSTARNARVSYLTHDKQQPNQKKDIGLHDRLVVAKPIHASPAEHVATPTLTSLPNKATRNFRGWIQYRAMLEGGL